MTSPSLLLPLRIPELGPSFGRLITGTRRVDRRVPLDDLRYQLVTEIIQRSGEARRLVANNERAAAVNILGRDVWLAAWEASVVQAAERVVNRLSQHIDAEARAVGMPQRLRARISVDPTERRAMAARIGSAGADLIPALDNVRRWGDAARSATARNRDDMERWQAALRSAARQLEDAWLALEDAVDAEVDRWLAVGDQVSRWRRPMWPVVVVGVVSTGFAVWIGLMYGGVIPSPRWAVALFALVGLA